MNVLPHDFLEHMGPALGGFWLIACLVNLVAAWHALRAMRSRLRFALWLAVAGGFAWWAARAWRGNPPGIPESLKTAIDAVSCPMSVTLAALAVLVLFYHYRRWLVGVSVGWGLVDLFLLTLGTSLVDEHFASTALQPDNLPLVGLVGVVAMSLWGSMRQAVENDRRLAEGGQNEIPQGRENVLVWRDLVYPEMIAMVLVVALLMVWALAVRAPLEGPANPALTPNPARAPWYFIGFQELLVYADPWLAGVVVPCLVVFGLAAIPYLDCNPQGSGQYTIERRRMAVPVFLLGFLMLWILPIVLGGLFRGPNWTFFGPYEPRDPQRLAATENITLASLFWTKWLRADLPGPMGEVGPWGRFGWVVWRESPGIALVACFFVLGPRLLLGRVLRRLGERLGATRYAILVCLLLVMLLVPLKMLLRWTWNVSYLVSMPEYLWNL